ncbi:MAG: hypothetical protein K0R80_2899 [Clostridia bacterium]|jgi:glycyl-tRNA synthetase beta subunit|nr:hypothetical protein [Clostridia bacterium]
MAKVLVSFKEKEKDLFKVVAEQGDKSNFMKDALKFYLKHKDQKINITPAVTEVKSEEIIDILESI